MGEVLKIGERITVLPVIHGSGDCAIQVRQLMLSQSFDCLAVPLPASFQEEVEARVAELPRPAIVLQRDVDFPGAGGSWRADGGEREGSQPWRDADVEGLVECSYVPIDPCQPVIAALRIAIGEHLRRAFIDLETRRYEPVQHVLPDPYALKRVAVERFAAAVLPSIPRPPQGQPQARVTQMARRLRELESRCRSILLVCSILDWPWIREAYVEAAAAESGRRPGDLSEAFSTPPEGWEDPAPVESFGVEPRTLLFLLGELPFVTGLYERARAELGDDENLSIDGVKELLLAARVAYRRELGRRARQITPLLLQQCLTYARNLSLIERRLTPDLYTLVTAAKQVGGDQYALHLAETASVYPFAPAARGDTSRDDSVVRMGIGRGRLPDGTLAALVSRLPGPPVVWRSCQLRRRPDRREVHRWQTRWNPYSQCSYPPEDELVENFRAHVFDRARAIMGADLARTEKFTTSLMDGLDIRDTLRHWYEGQLYVKVLPPNRGRLDCAVMLFDSPADPRDYPWRTTWFAEHQDESTLAFFATDFRQEMVGPGIGLATYGGALFLYPPVAIPDIWNDPRLDFATTLEERLLGAGCLYSQSRHVAVLSGWPPGSGWRKLARRFRKTLVHVPLGHFSEATVQQLRMVHVLNGKQVRSYAARFIRKA